MARAAQLESDDSTFLAGLHQDAAVALRVARRLAPAGDAEDVAQEAMLAAWRYRRRRPSPHSRPRRRDAPVTDDDIDATLRRLGAAWRSSASDSPAVGLSDLDRTTEVRDVAQASRRPHRRITTLAAAGLAVAAWVVVTVLVSHVRSGTADGTDPVAAASASATASVASPSPSDASADPTPAASAPPCTAAQLSASVGPHGSAAGTENILIVLTNSSGETCTLGGKVELRGVHADGTVDNPGFTSYTDPGYAPASPAGPPGPIAPGAAGGFVLAEGLNCTPIEGDYTALRIEMAHGLAIDMPWDAMFAGCSPIVGPAGPIPRVDAGSTLSSLTAGASAG